MSTSNMEINPQGLAAFLIHAGLGRKIVELEPEQNFFTQGDPADAVFFLEKGRAKLSVVSKMGKQATIALLSPGGFFGEESLAAVSAVRNATAIAVNTCTALRIKREDMIRIMHQEPDFCRWCWPAASAPRPIWSTNSSTRAKSDWPARCS